ncbi:DUF4351 domain-containing protein [Cylindrospermopsis curvispora]|uniref:DUF4351 domain-containing protein n=1 Tax=Cylindrospermopsis curvispora GIHE-G1 TaxID=2666332 RepID=A0A7H0F1L6_9CYAN|nr:DUF4351 domain-containing protein [Cylindrospermopsis curvispora]QNP29932.1 DUF4351 domain-containing protein [Cylindrospermopsis curvispora GIHE-G1]
MTRFIHDQFAKDYLEEILRPYGEIESSKRVPGEVRLYHLGKSLRTKIVAIHHLPNTPETLWLRILGRGKVRTKAIDQLEKLTEDHPLRRKVLELLYTLRQNLEQSGKAEEREDKELIMRLAPLYQQDIEKVRQEGLQEGELRGEQRGRQEGQRKIILLLLNHKFDGIELPVVERINRLSLEQLEAMGESLLDFKQISDLEAWLKDAEKSNDLKPQVDIQNGNQLDV